MSPVARAEIVVDLAAIRHNVRLLRELAAPAAMMTVVKADGYGHGLVPAARAAREAGAEWLGVATIEEALELRESGDEGRMLCWLGVPGENYAGAIAADVDVSAYTVAELAEIRAGVARAGRPPGCSSRSTPASPGAARRRRTGRVSSSTPAPARRRGTGPSPGSGRTSRAATSPTTRPTTPRRRSSSMRSTSPSGPGSDPRCVTWPTRRQRSCGPRPGSTWFAAGSRSYGLDPAPGVTPDIGLVPAMTARAALSLAKPIRSGAGVSYGHTWTADHDTTVGLVPVGYGDGVPRHAGNVAEVWLAGRRRPVRGRICMDQFVVDLDGELPDPGAGIVLFGTGFDGEPTATEWAEACGTINYEIVTRIGGRMVRRYVDEGVAR